MNEDADWRDWRPFTKDQFLELLTEGVFQSIPTDLYPMLYRCYQARRVPARPILKQKLIKSTGWTWSSCFHSSGGGTTPLAIDPQSGDFFLATRSDIKSFKPDGTLEEALHIEGTDGGICDLIFDYEGNLMLLDGREGDIKIFDQKTNTMKAKFGNFNDPRAFTLDNEGNIVVCDTGNHKICIVTPTGVLITEFGSKGSTPGYLNFPCGVAVNPPHINNNIFVSEHENNQIQVFSPSGESLQIIGSLHGRELCQLPGVALLPLQKPWGITIDGNGRLVIMDEFNRRIKIFSNDGTLLSFSDGVPYPETVRIDKHGNLVVVVFTMSNPDVLIF